MKRRRTLIVSLLLVAALCLGIGYAAFSSEMKIEGSATVDAIDNQVVFSNAVAGATDDADGAVLIDKTGIDTKTLTLSTGGFKEVGDTVEVTVTISNPHDFAVVLSDYQLTRTNKVLTPTNADCLSITLNPTTLNDMEIPAGSTKTFTITIECVKTTVTGGTESFTITYNADAKITTP